MLLATVEQTRAIDRVTTEKFGVSPALLMEAAGASSAREILSLYGAKPAHIVCGTGNNGGDGLVVARYLHAAGVKTRVYVVAKSGSELFNIQLKRLNGLNIEVRDLKELPRAPLVVDALLGIGLSRRIEGLYVEYVKKINQSKICVSLDVPSGLDVDRGVVLGQAVKATVTLTFGLAKPGFFVQNGPEHVGKLKILPLSFPPEAKESEAQTHFLFTKREARNLLPQRSRVSNKARHGRVVICAGSRGKWGAALLACRGAYAVGAGYVTLASFEDSSAALASLPEVLTRDASKMEFNSDETYVVGPGLGLGRDTAQLVKELKNHGCENVILDADAFIVSTREKLFPLSEKWILTPHAGELSRALGWSSERIESDRFDAVFSACKELGGTVLLKGFRTIVGAAGKFGVVFSGNAALAKAGTGDVLAGIIGSLMAQGLKPQDAALLGAYVHGRVADDWVREGLDQRSFLPSELVERLPVTLKKISDP